MLSYLKDANQTPAAADMEDGQTPNPAPQHYLTVSGHGKKVQQGTLVLAVLFAVGGAGLWLMIKKAAPATVNAAPNADQQQIEAALAQLNTVQGEMDTQMNSVVDRFYEFSRIQQISVDELKKNPFMRELQFDPEDGPADAGLAQRQQLQQEAQQRMMNLELWSITATPRGMCCMINDKVLYENDKINGMTIRSISDAAVTLEYQGVPVQLKMEQ